MTGAIEPVIYSRTYKTIFVHNQKTGGSSVEGYFFTHVPDAANLLPRHTYATQGVDKLGAAWAENYSFGFVRNPWARLVSWYSMIAERPDEGQRNPLFAYVRRNSSNFEEFLVNCTETVSVKKKHGVRYEKSFVRNQLDYFADSHGQVAVNFIGRFEQLVEDFNRVIQAAGLPNHPLPHTNVTATKDYRDSYTEKTRNLVADRFAKDIQYFGYEF